MTEDQLSIFQLKAKLAAQELALGLIVRSLSRDQSQRESLRRCISEINLAGNERTTPGVAPEFSMLFAAETRDAFEALAKVLKAKTEY